IGGGAGDSITLSDGDNRVLGDSGSIDAVLVSAISDGFGAGDAITLGSGADSVAGGAGGDTLILGDGANVALGDFGTILGTTDVTVTSAADILGGDDTISGGADMDAIIGGDGADAITTGAATDAVLGDNGVLTRIGGLFDLTSTDPASGAADVIDLGSGANFALGGSGADTITTESGLILGDHGRIEHDGSASLIGETLFDTEGGADILTATGDTAGLVGLIGGVSGDTVFGTGENVAILGDAGRIAITLGAQPTLRVDSQASAGGAADTLDADGANLTLAGGDGGDEITAGSALTASLIVLGDHGFGEMTGGLRDAGSTESGIGGDDTIILSATGEGIVIAGVGADGVTDAGLSGVIFGDEGRAGATSGGDTSLATAIGGNDTITSQAGSDVIIGGAGDDVISGFGDADYAIAGDAAMRIGTLGLQALDAGAGGADAIIASGGDDRIVGGIGMDTIDAGAGDDAILGDMGRAIAGELTAEFIEVGAADLIAGGAGADSIIGGAGMDTLDGADGSDAILGDAGRIVAGDLFSEAIGSGDADSITGGSGDDDLIGGEGEDEIDGGAGADAIIGDLGRIEAGALTSEIPATGGNDTIRGMDGDDSIIGGAGDDQIDGGADADAILGDLGSIDGAVLTSSFAQIGGDDTIDAGDGADAIIGGVGSDDIDAGAGADRVLADAGRIDAASMTAQSVEIGGADVVLGGAGDDAIIGGTGADTIDGGADDDIILGDIGTVATDLVQSQSVEIGTADLITGGTGDDIIFGGAGADSIDTGTGSNIAVGDSAVLAGLLLDTVESTADGGDTLTGGSDSDILIGGGGADSLTGNDGADLLLGDGGSVGFSGGAIVSALSVADTRGASDTLDGGAGDDVLIGAEGSDSLIGAAGDDVMLGDAGRLTFVGTQVATLELIDQGIGAADTLNGGTGDDLMVGQAGADVMSATGGHNLMIGDLAEMTFFTPGSLNIGASAVERVETLSTVRDDIAGADTLTGGAGRDMMIGGMAADRMVGGAGQDLMFGDTLTMERVYTYDSTVRIWSESMRLSTQAGTGGGNDLLVTGADHSFLVGGSGTNFFDTDFQANFVAPGKASLTVTGFLLRDGYSDFLTRNGTLGVAAPSTGGTGGGLVSTVPSGFATDTLIEVDTTTFDPVIPPAEASYDASSTAKRIRGLVDDMTRVAASSSFVAEMMELSRFDLGAGMFEAEARDALRSGMIAEGAFDDGDDALFDLIFEQMILDMLSDIVALDPEMSAMAAE
ncbi:calcium-binding protein, partial [Roseobacter sp. HKCCA0434]|uniref:beta strand repeat-containing protein n=1 Tax=Roseobacter sp. HKCCA0434 TaxID=3079297 RepID=UPI002905934B